jgi:hypothetical protein
MVRACEQVKNLRRTSLRLNAARTVRPLRTPSSSGEDFLHDGDVDPTVEFAGHLAFHANQLVPS